MTLEALSNQKMLIDWFHPLYYQTGGLDSALGFVFIPSHPCQKLVDGSCDAGGFGDVWFNGRVREDGNTIPGINFHRNIHLLTAALTGSFLGERRLMWNALQVLTQRRSASKLSSIPEVEGPHLFFALTLVRGSRQRWFQPARTGQGTEREQEGTWDKWVCVPLLGQIKSRKSMRVWSRTASCQWSLNYHHFVICWNKAAFFVVGVMSFNSCTAAKAVDWLNNHFGNTFGQYCCLWLH